MNICLFTPEELKKSIPLSDERVQHLVKILHKKPGDSFAAGVIGGQAGLARIVSLENSLELEFFPESDGKPLSNLVMIIGFPRPIQLKRLLRDVAGLGVAQIHLTATELGEKSYMQSTLVERGSAYKMLLDGTVQAGSTHVPELFLHRTLPECLSSVEGSASGGLKILLDNVRPDSSLAGFMRRSTSLGDLLQRKIVAAIGSERGWTDRERDIFSGFGYSFCGMGRRIFRTETAATVAASIILAEEGAL